MKKKTIIHMNIGCEVEVECEEEEIDEITDELMKEYVDCLEYANYGVDSAWVDECWYEDK